MEEFRDLAVNNQAELDRIKAGAMVSSLYNEDLAPTGPEQRTWTTYNIAALWIGMSIVITTYLLAAGLMAAGMNWWQALLTISLGNVLVLIPMLLNAHAGTKYGVPFPVFVRASFGVRGANFAAIARALVACGWFGIQTWLGGAALDALVTAAWGGWANITGHTFIAFLVFWAIQLIIILTGVEGVKWFESFSAPLLIGGGVALLIWGFIAGGGVINVFSTSAELQQGNAPFWTLFWPSLAANVGYWITLSLNIPDFTRYAKTQRSQVIGQALGLPLTMTAFSFIGIAVTAATIVVFDEAIWDPLALVTRLTGDIPALLILAMFIIAIAQISTNMAANVVSPSFDFSNLAPKYISFRTGGIITAVIGVLSFPWLILETAGAYIFTWLVGYGSLLGAIGAVMIVELAGNSGCPRQRGPRPPWFRQSRHHRRTQRWSLPESVVHREPLQLRPVPHVYRVRTGVPGIVHDRWPRRRTGPRARGDVRNKHARRLHFRLFRRGGAGAADRAWTFRPLHRRA
jgi:NCS1 family nucleobase:cation symporter-1